MKIDLGTISITNGSLLIIDLKCSLAERLEILGCSVANLPKYFDYKMIKECYHTRPDEKLKYLLEILETGDTRNCVVTFA